MPNVQHFGANTLAGFVRSSAAVTEITTAGRFDSAETVLAISIPTNADYAESHTFSETTLLLSVVELYRVAGTVNAATAMSWFNGATEVYRIRTVASGATAQFQYWNGSAWTNAGSAFTVSQSALHRLAISIDLTGSFEVFLNGVSIASGGSFSGHATTITKERLSSWQQSDATQYSQVMLANYDCKTSKLRHSALSGNSGTNADGTGAYTDVNEVPLDDSTKVTLSTSAHKRGFTHTGITVPAGYQVAAMVINARGRANGSITDGKLGVRSGGTNYSSTARSYGTGYEPRSHIVTTDPATATNFDQTGFNAAEPYVEAA